MSAPLLGAAQWPGAACELLVRSHAETEVWRVHRGGQTVGWLKRHANVGRARREAQAIRDWGTALGWSSVSVQRDGPVLALPHQPGVAATELPPSEESWLYERIGERLRVLRQHAAPPDAMPLQEALGRRVAGWDARAEGVVPEALRRRVRQAWQRPLPAVTRTPCHRDVQLHNVVVHEGRVVLLDLGQAAGDLPAMDVVKLVERGVAEPSRRALLRGLGCTAQEPLWERCRLLHGLATWVWAARHQDVAGLALGEAILRR